MTTPFPLDRSTVLVTGATRGIGRAMTEQLVAQGATVLAVARDAGALADLAGRHPGRIHGHAADLAAPGAAAGIALWVAAQHPGCNLLINNAAIMVHTRLTDRSEGHDDEIAREVAVNLTAPVTLATRMLPILATHPDAGVVNIATGLAVAPIANASVYCATKSGLRSFSRTFRYQCEDAGLPVGVTDVVMTLVDTDLSHGDGAAEMGPEAAAAAVLAGIAARQQEIWIGKTRLLRRIFRLWPGLAYRIMRARTPDRARPAPAAVRSGPAPGTAP